MFLPEDASSDMYLAALASWKRALLVPGTSPQYLSSCRFPARLSLFLPISHHHPLAFLSADSQWPAGSITLFLQPDCPEKPFQTPRLGYLSAFRGPSHARASSCPGRTSPRGVLSFCVCFPVMCTSRAALCLSHLSVFTSSCLHSNSSAARL